MGQRTDSFRAEGVISFRSGYTQVAGHKTNQPCEEGWSTLSTVVIDGLNVLEVLTADRVVGQIVTHHPHDGYVPSISFLGTRFENLRIAGHPVTLDLDLEILGPRPANDKPYGLDSALKERVARQYDLIRKCQSLPAEHSQRYNQLSKTLGTQEAVDCSLVNNATGDFPGSSCGHMILIPSFGWVSLATVKVTYEEIKENNGIQKKTTVKLTMVDFHLHCSASGHLAMCRLSTNGQNWP